jgi:[acyl-carrier-protein] S-malonyltransferase
MESARKGLQPLLGAINWEEPVYTVLSNVTGMPYNSAAEMPELLGKQVVGSVRWEDNCRWILFQGIENYYEVGPGKVLQGLMKKIESAASVVSVETPEEIECGIVE